MIFKTSRRSANCTISQLECVTTKLSSNNVHHNLITDSYFISVVYSSCLAISHRNLCNCWILFVLIKLYTWRFCTVLMFPNLKASACKNGKRILLLPRFWHTKWLLQNHPCDCYRNTREYNHWYLTLQSLQMLLPFASESFSTFYYNKQVDELSQVSAIGLARWVGLHFQFSFSIFSIYLLI